MRTKTKPAAPVTIPAKRGRGRPRKDRGAASSQTPQISAPETATITQPAEGNQGDGAAENMMGRTVFGVIDGCFDGGHLLTVRVGDTGTLLRGVVFVQERVAGVTAENDVAPRAVMCQRRDIPVPVFPDIINLQGQEKNDRMQNS